MPLQHLNTADKIIVDRRKHHLNSDVTHSVHQTHDRLWQQPGDFVFDREILKIHAQSIVTNSATMPLLVVSFAAVGVTLGTDGNLLMWMLIGVCHMSVWRS